MTSDVCPSGADFGDHIADFEFIKAFICPYDQQVGLLTTGLIVYGAIALALYIRTDSIIIPVVLLLVTGGATMGLVAAVGTGIAILALLGMGAGTMAYLYLQHSP